MKAHRKGYSITEVLVVIAIISIMISIVLVNAVPLLAKVKRILGGL